jgi:hypothetical protein
LQKIAAMEARGGGVFQVNVGEIDDVVAVAYDVVSGIVLPAQKAVPFGGLQEILGEIRWCWS